MIRSAAPAAEKPQATSKAKVKARRQGKKRREGKKPAIRSSDEILNAVLTALAGGPHARGDTKTHPRGGLARDDDTGDHRDAADRAAAR